MFIVWMIYEHFVNIAVINLHEIVKISIISEVIILKQTNTNRNIYDPKQMESIIAG